MMPINTAFKMICLPVSQNPLFSDNTPSPGFHAPRLDHYLKPLLPSKQLDDYHWSVLLFTWGRALFDLIAMCFQMLFLKKERSEIPELDEKGKRSLFNISIDYENFHDQILNYKKGSKLIYNNYSFASFLELKEGVIFDGIDKLEGCDDQDQRDRLGGIATYDAIVDLFVGRFLIQHPDMNQESYLSSLRFIALCLAIKISYDQQIWNSDFLFFLPAPFSIDTHKKMEVEFLKGIEWNISQTETLA